MRSYGFGFLAAFFGKDGKTGMSPYQVLARLKA
jgi:hypothetical protein